MSSDLQSKSVLALFFCATVDILSKEPKGELLGNASLLRELRSLRCPFCQTKQAWGKRQNLY